MTAKKRKSHLRMSIGLSLVFLLLSGGCAEKTIDRSHVNDPLMSLGYPSATSNLSPLTGLTARGRASGGTACSVCAQ